MDNQDHLESGVLVLKIKKRKILAFLIALVICFNIITSNTMYTGYAAPYTIIYITSPEDLINLSKECSNDAYSVDKMVILKNDINLSGYSFNPIPVFSGIFDGNGCTISGIDITVSGSFQGFIRYATKSSEIRNLILDFNITANGSGSYIGGIAGSNNGIITGCTTIGSIDGVSICGGVVGINDKDGIIVNCANRANITSINKPGGIAGFNYGSIGGCGNEGTITFKAGSNLDAGGIAGISAGKIIDCANAGEIGTVDLGRNVGGIVGRATGYISECTNNGNVTGIKDVGGIVGQYDIRIAYVAASNLLTNADATVADDSSDTNTSSNDGDSSDEDIDNIDEDDINNDEDDYVDEVFDEDNDYLIEDDEIDEDDENIDENSLNENYVNDSNISADEDTIYENNDNSDNILSYEDINDLEAGLESESPNTLPEAVVKYGFNSSDKPLRQIVYCINLGDITAEYDVGGITGNISYELTGNSRENPSFDEFEDANTMELIGCLNEGNIYFSTNNAGGIVGYAATGIITYNASKCTITGYEGSYVGGIAGNSNVEISKSFSICTLNARAYVGGIAGSSRAITECYSLPTINDAEQKGAIAGRILDLIDACYFIDEDLQAVDGINYNLKTFPISIADMAGSGSLPLAYDNFEESDWCVEESGIYLPAINYIRNNGAKYISDTLTQKIVDFTEFEITVNFYDGDTLIKTITLEYGGSLDENDIPNVPLHSGEYGEWSEFPMEHLTKGMDIYAIYSPWLSSISSQETPPIVIVEGTFDNNATVTLYELSKNDVRYQADYSFITGYNIMLDDNSNNNDTIMVHYLTSLDDDTLKLIDAKGYNIPYERDGDYVIFQLYEDRTFSVFEYSKDYTHIKILVVAAVILVILVIIIILTRKIIKKGLTKRKRNTIILK